jgi:hypothetical protein
MLELLRPLPMKKYLLIALQYIEAIETIAGNEMVERDLMQDEIWNEAALIWGANTSKPT